MPVKPKKCCTTPHCPTLTEGGPCEKHKRQREQRRGSAAERGYGYRWQKYATWFLSQPENAICRRCEERGRVTASTLVDHIIPVKGPDDPLFWEPSNHQGLDFDCHQAKTREDIQKGLTR